MADTPTCGTVLIVTDNGHDTKHSCALSTAHDRDHECEHGLRWPGAEDSAA